MTSSGPILVIGGSVRPRRISPAVAAWVARVGGEVLGAPFEVIDLKDWLLPMDDEPAMPHGGVYDQGHTRAWSRKVAEAAGVVFVSPQYNGGYPAPLKNAIDHLYPEWKAKPAAIVTYGGHGGSICSGQLLQVCERLSMRVAATRPQMVLSRARIEANTGEVEPATEFAAHLADLRQAFGELAALINEPVATPQGG